MVRLPQANIIRQLVVRNRARRPVQRELISHINTVCLGELGFLPGGVGDLEPGGSAFSVTFVDRRAGAGAGAVAVTTTNAVNTFEGQDDVAIATTKVMDVEVNRGIVVLPVLDGRGLQRSVSVAGLESMRQVIDGDEFLALIGKRTVEETGERVAASLVARVCTRRTVSDERNREKHGPYGACGKAAIFFVHSPANLETGVVASGIVGREFDAGADLVHHFVYSGAVIAGDKGVGSLMAVVVVEGDEGCCCAVGDRDSYTTSPKDRKRAARDLKVESNIFQSSCTSVLVKDQEMSVYLDRTRSVIEELMVLFISPQGLVCTLDFKGD